MSKNILGIFGVLTAIAAGTVAAVTATNPPAAKPGPANTAVTGKASELSPQQTQFFETKVRPILAAKCYKCHSMDGGKVKGALLLDSREGWMKGGENGKVIEPGNAAKSRLVVAIGYKDADLQMPPKGEKLTDQQIADMTAWINMGAPDPRTLGAGAAAKLSGLTDKARSHWAYQPIKQPAIPVVKDSAWVKSPVDAFILEKLEANGLKPNRAATKEALLRRAYYDLIGLPPTPEELSDFLKDHMPNAFEKVVDRLLASSHYGERWARFWLDSARYADTTGDRGAGNKNDYRFAYSWTYRDYVINSLNQDKPYDQFLMEQIAADQLPDAAKNPESLAALGFLTVGKRFPNVNDTIDERIDTICKAMLGMTVTCARCHDHKFDPIPQMDYYSLHGVLSSIKEPDPAEEPLISKAVVSADSVAFDKKMADLVQENRDAYFTFVGGRNKEFRKHASAYMLQQELNNYRHDTAAMQLRIKVMQAAKLDPVIMHEGIGGFGLIPKGNTADPLNRLNSATDEEWNEKARKYWEDLKGGRRHIDNLIVRKAIMELDPEKIHSLQDFTDVYAKVFESVSSQADEYFESCRTATKDTVLPVFDKDVMELIQFPVPVEPAYLITTEHLHELMLTRVIRTSGDEFNKMFVFGKINELALLNPSSPRRAMAVLDDKPHDDPVFIRGEAANKGPMAPRRFLEILSGKTRENFKIGSGRLELARAIGNKNNPMTPRVMINRIWMHHFGDGFVRTPDDLGVQSETPSHQELLDYLAARFIEEGWSIKKIHKLIMMSSTYQQSADNNPAFALKDPANRLLWRANVRRLDFEAIRDTLLMFTGNLDSSIGGHPVNLTDEPYSYRRSIYGFIDRGDMPDLLQQFDFSDPDRPNSHRTSTIVPQQALFFMNSSMAADVARKVVRRPDFLSAGSDIGRVRALYMVLFQRAPQEREVALASLFFNVHDPSKIKVYDASAIKKTTKSEKKMDGKRVEGIQNQGGDIVEKKPLSLWEEYAQALLFTNEVAYVN